MRRATLWPGRHPTTAKRYVDSPGSNWGMTGFRVRARSSTSVICWSGTGRRKPSLRMRTHIWPTRVSHCDLARRSMQRSSTRRPRPRTGRARMTARCRQRRRATTAISPYRYMSGSMPTAALWTSLRRPPPNCTTARFGTRRCMPRRPRSGPTRAMSTPSTRLRPQGRARSGVSCAIRRRAAPSIP